MDFWYDNTTRNFKQMYKKEKHKREINQTYFLAADFNKDNVINNSYGVGYSITSFEIKEFNLFLKIDTLRWFTYESDRLYVWMD